MQPISNKIQQSLINVLIKSSLSHLLIDLAFMIDILGSDGLCGHFLGKNSKPITMFLFSVSSSPSMLVEAEKNYPQSARCPGYYIQYVCEHKIACNFFF